MFLAYVDDSGDTGRGRGNSKTYTLGCVLVLASSWPRVFDELIDFRRFLKDRFGVPVRAELKANYLIGNRGPFLNKPLSERARRRIYQLAMRRQRDLGTKTFAVVIDKEKLWGRRPDADPREVAWEYLLQRLERLSTKTKDSPVMVFHDEGEAATIRKLARRARRIGTAGSAFGTGSLSRPAKYLIDDPVSRDSQHSYFVQLADLNAYAAFRDTFPPPPRTAQIVPPGTWNEIGRGRFRPANKNAGGTPGIVVWPR
jgi:hypothetical protein